MERLELIKRMQAFGFPLVEIREMLELKFARGHSCQNVQYHLKRKLELIDRQIGAMRKLRREVAGALKKCEESLKLHATGDFCPIVDAGLDRPVLSPDE
jgi:DNA-binding transcriptional MerR regulator